MSNINLIVKATERLKNEIENNDIYNDGDHPFTARPNGNYHTGQIGRPNRFSMASLLICENAYKVLIG